MTANSLSMSLSSSSQLFPLTLFLSLSLYVNGGIRSLSPEGLAEIILVSHGMVEGVLRCHITDVANVKVNLMGRRLSMRGRKRRDSRYEDPSSLSSPFLYPCIPSCLSCAITMLSIPPLNPQTPLSVSALCHFPFFLNLLPFIIYIIYKPKMYNF